jgi:NAD(P)H-flavin reductase/NAD-dependent dihydropyrimidine dehydrogenase PreA subunit
VKQYQHLFFIKTNRTFSSLKRFSWTLVPVIAVGGLFWPKLGLLMVPIMLTIIVMSMLRGKYWCGNVCPHGSLFDNLLLPFTRNKAIPRLLQSNFLKIGFFAFFMVMFALRVSRVIGSWGTLSFYDKLGFVLALNYLIPTILGVTLALTVSSRAWCSICPMGMMQQIMYKVGKLTRLTRFTDRKIALTQPEQCHKCAKCARVCPMQLTPYQEADHHGVLHAEACIRCGTCVAHCPAGILSVEHVRDLAAAPLTVPAQRQAIEAVLISNEEIALHTRELFFQAEKLKKFNFQPGQFVLIRLFEHLEMFRAYSISGFDGDRGILRVTVKLIENGFGSEIIRNEFSIGKKFLLEGPMGEELIVDKTARKVVLIGGGIGITPFLPIVDELLESSPPPAITLIHGAAKPDELYYHEYFQRLTLQDSSFTYLPVVEAGGEAWAGSVGTVITALEEVDLSDSNVYICGSGGMVKALRGALARHGLPEEQVFAESA